MVSSPKNGPRQEYRPPLRTPVLDSAPITAEAFKPVNGAPGNPACLRSRLASALREAAADLGVLPKDLLVISGLDGSPDPVDCVNCYGVRGLGARAPAFALGSRSANPGLSVVVFSSSGGGVGSGYLLEAARRSLNITCVLLNGGSCGRRGDPGELNPEALALSLSAGAAFGARLHAGGADFPAVFREAMGTRGLAVIDCLGLCPACGDGEALEALKARMRPTGRDHDSTRRRQALAAASEAPESWAMGVLYRSGGLETWDDRDPALSNRRPLVEFPAPLGPEALAALWDQFR